MDAIQDKSLIRPGVNTSLSTQGDLPDAPVCMALTKQLFLSASTFTHLPETGLNPLVDAADSVFFEMTELKHLRVCEDFSVLQQKLIAKIKNFQSIILQRHYKDDQLAEYTALCCYALCATLDHLIYSSAWGGKTNWAPYQLVAHFVANPPSEAHFFIILERLIRDPDIYIDVIEFMYICLNLGLKFSSPIPEFTEEQMNQVIQSLYNQIRNFRGNFNKNLSPFSIKTEHKLTAPPSWLNTIILKNTFDLIRKITQKNKPHYSLVTLNQMDLLKDNFSFLQNFLQSHSIIKHRKKIRLSQLPLFLMISNANSGKTTLLKNANIHYLLSQRDISKKENSQFCHWWVTSENVLVDVPSQYFQKNEAHPLWDTLLEQIKIQRGKLGLNGIVFALSLSDLSSSDNRENVLNHIQDVLVKLEYIFKKKFPFYFVITQCDLLPGFLEFFSDSSQEELSQAWGIVLPEDHKKSFVEIFVSRFNCLIKRLNSQLIWRLHKEKISLAKFKIKNFPLQIEYLKHNIILLLRELPSSFILKGVFLTSGSQATSELNSLYPQLIEGPTLQRSFQILHHSPISPHGYFIKQLIMQGLTG